MHFGDVRAATYQVPGHRNTFEHCDSFPINTKMTDQPKFHLKMKKVFLRIAISIYAKPVAIRDVGVKVFSNLACNVLPFIDGNRLITTESKNRVIIH